MMIDVAAQRDAMVRELVRVCMQLEHREKQVKELQGRCSELLEEVRALRAAPRVPGVLATLTAEQLSQVKPIDANSIADALAMGRYEAPAEERCARCRGQGSVLVEVHGRSVGPDAELRPAVLRTKSCPDCGRKEGE